MLNDKKIIKSAMGLRGISYQKLAEMSGMGTAVNLSGIINRGTAGMRIDKFYDMLTALGCEIIIKDKMGTKTVWKLERLEDSE